MVNRMVCNKIDDFQKFGLHNLKKQKGNVEHAEFSFQESVLESEFVKGVKCNHKPDMYVNVTTHSQ